MATREISYLIPFRTYKNFPHCMPTTEADTINADLLAFLKKSKQMAA
jgi:hypothetical protein